VFGLSLLVSAILSVPAPVTRTMSLPSGHAHARFSFMAEQGSAFRDIRLIVPHGAVVSVSAHDLNKQMGVDVSTTLRRSPVARCIQRRRYDICDQQQEACPILSAHWVADVVKRSSAPARIRLTFFFTSSG
jgi:hypothetical protein